MASFFGPKFRTRSSIPRASRDPANRSYKQSKLTDAKPSILTKGLVSAAAAATVASSPSADPKPAHSIPKAEIAPYPEGPCSSPTPHPNVTVDPIRTAHIPSLMRTTALLLPVRYQNSFYSATITDPVIASVSRAAVYHDPRLSTTITATPTTDPNAPVPSSDKVIGGIRCRLEPVPTVAEAAGNDLSAPGPTNLYIQALHLLSPYRGNGIASSLLNSMLYAPSSNTQQSSSSSRRPLSAIVKHYNIRSVTAHVHETNTEALAWYVARGFKIQDGVIENYYRRLKPSGARLVKLNLVWDDYEHETEGENDREHISLTDVDDDDGGWEMVHVEEDSADENYHHIDGKSRKKLKSSR